MWFKTQADTYFAYVCAYVSKAHTRKIKSRVRRGLKFEKTRTWGGLMWTVKGKEQSLDSGSQVTEMEQELRKVKSNPPGDKCLGENVWAAERT